MSGIIIVGTQWGDEGKGKIVDHLAEKANIIARYGGGNNAGHTVVLEDEKYAFHLIPSGVLYPDKLLVLGNGMVIDPEVLTGEINSLRKRGVEMNPERMRISSHAHVIMPYHRDIDGIQGGKVGTTGRGIGPTYAEKANRTEAIRMGDFVRPDFMDRLGKVVEDKFPLLSFMGVIPEGLSEKDYLIQLYEQLAPYAEFLASYVDGHIPELLDNAINSGKNVLLEGAQATLLDIDHGTYPYVTSSNPTVGGACTGLGIAPNKIDEIIGVVKAYTTRVGNGPFPTELINELGDRIREVGKEYGTTTGRPRRVGWLDIPIVRYAAIVNGLTGIALTKADVLNEIDPLRVCVAYEVDDERTNVFPIDDLDRAIPIYEEMQGWEDASRIEGNFRRYIEKIEELTRVPVKIVSYGPNRRETIFR